MTDSILAPIAALSLPDQAGLQSRAQGVLAFIQQFQIATHEDFGLAADELKAIKGKQKALEEQRTAITGPLNAATKAVNDLFRAPAAFLDQAEALLKTNMLGYQRKVEAEERAQREAAEREAERVRAAAAAEAAAKAAEAEAAAKAASEAAAAGDAQAAQIAEAQAQRAQADAAAATATAVMAVAAPVVDIAAPKVKGVSTSTAIDFEVTGLLQLVHHIAQHPELINLIRTDDVRLRAYVKGLGVACKLPGVRVFEKHTLAARAA
ncbi:MAG: hypothetical protein HY855_25005 [Burkholderiales bacterium]|nr:hypothetical protein [Burkholderiales bacterium]